VLTDKRARLRPKGGYQKLFQGPALPLASEGELVFPYTPTVTYNRTSNYGTYDLPHTNYQPKYWQNTTSPNIQLTAQFTSNTQEEALYTVGALHFLRMCQLGHFGASDPMRGSPPPIIEFSAYGRHLFENFPVIVSDVSYTLDSEVDYVEYNDTTNLDVNIVGYGANSQGATVVPTSIIVAVSLTHQPNLTQMREEFNVDDISTGRLLGRGFV
tara:strand:+ start:5742 stop:6380 length:639 start_codon:yes stop_codon:yes gene_type:complete